MSKTQKEFDQLLKLAKKELPPKAPVGLKTMLDVLFHKISVEDMEFFDPLILANLAQTHWSMAKRRERGKPQLQIYCFASEGGECRKTIIDIVSDDMAFLVDSVASEINNNDLLIGILIHPTIYAHYDKKGGLRNVSAKAEENYIRQSHIHIQINETLSAEAIEKLEKGLYTVLDDVYIANVQWQPLLAQLKNASGELSRAFTGRSAAEIHEYCAFLDYLYNNNFTLLGCREYEFVETKGGVESKTVKGSSLGLLQDDIKPAYISDSEEGLPHHLQEMRRDLPPVSISKTNRMSTVHRSVPMDAIAIKTYDDKGNVKGERLFLGLFTSVTYSRSVSDVPYLRKKVERVVEMSGFMQGSHNRKALRHILEKYPRDELFQIHPEELLTICQDIIRLQERQRIALFMRKDPFGRYISCLVYVPRDRFGTKLRKEMEKILERETNGVCKSFYTTLDDSVFARVLYVINVNQKDKMNVKARKIEELLRECGQTWPERLTQAMSEAYEDDHKITNLSLKYNNAFPVSYSAHYSAKQAVFDIEKAEKVLESGRLILDLYKPSELDKNRLRLKIYNKGSPITLSEVLPILENMGLWAIAELPFEIRPEREKESVWIHDFLLEIPDMKTAIDIDKIKVEFEKAFAKTWYNEVENDGLNQLVLSAGTNWHELTIIRAYVRYLKQISFPFSQTYIEKALSDNPKIARMIIDLFKAYHNPENGKAAAKKAEKKRSEIEKALEAVASIDYDRILRAFVSLVEATMRTNYYQRQESGSAKRYLALKFDSSAVTDMPEPKPFREIFVYSPRMEAVHLRGDMIARGGLRWSDRHEDFRTEILGLMKSQMVKNAVIVPMGSKGGFVVKTPTNSRDEFIKEGIACYKTFISGLLDITDNRKGDKIIKPKDVVRRDGDDPYLVVAADKGTATFSDIANSLSEEYGFWLGDAFASGGSAGYDHKKMGITARGAWESVKAHFRQFNHDTQKQPFDVIGVGDMGGDVFGNGMLLSEHIRLVGAFNHLHIFCDPEPDEAKSFAERKRLFEKIGGWDQYNEKLLSKGGKIFSRSDKLLILTPEIRKRFDISKEKVSPVELLRAMLGARTDLLWFGGIGTYIKSSGETHPDVGDKANDAIRLNAQDVHAKVIGEGANLGVTQLGRIELAKNRVRINTDFLDNSGGVDSSDHEVNIKILMTDVMSNTAHKVDIKKRNAMLEQMEAEVVEHVLRHNYQQAQAISLVELQARENLQWHEEFIEEMEREKGLDREIEGLPDSEAIEQRLRLGKGLTRPELCVLLSYAKISLTEELLDSDIPDNPEMQYWLTEYFPTLLHDEFKPEILRHRLKREIIATMMANSLVDRMGPTFLKSRMKKTGAAVEDIVEAYIVVRDSFNLPQIWDDIEALDGKVPAEVQLKAMREVALLSEHAITWFLTRLGRDLDIKTDVIGFGEGVAALQANMDKLVTDGLKDLTVQRTAAILSDGLPKALSRQIALMPVLSSACDIVRISLEQNTDLMNTARTYFELGERFHLDWLRQQARFLPGGDQWETEAAEGLIEHLFSCQAGMTVKILKDMNGALGKGKESKESSIVEKWLEKYKHQVGQLDPVFAELRRSGTVDMAMLTVAEQRLRHLYGG